MALLSKSFRDQFWIEFAAESTLNARIPLSRRYKLETKGASLPDAPQDADLPDTWLIMTQSGFGPWGDGAGSSAGRRMIAFEWHIRLRDLSQTTAEEFAQLMVNLFITATPGFGSSAAGRYHVEPGPVDVTVDVPDDDGDGAKRVILVMRIEVKFLNVSRHGPTAIE